MDSESSVLLRAHDQFFQQYRADRDAANKLVSVGETPRDPALGAVRHAAMTMTASLILNLDETITKE
jgi:hypothetical protein